jgi:putative flippase GtrA
MNYQHSFFSSSLFRFIKFGLVGGSGVVVNVALFHILSDRLTFDYRIASILAIECAIINNFFWNYNWTWRDCKTSSKRKFSYRILKFHLSSGLTALIVNWGLLVLLTDIFKVQYHIPNIADHNVSNLIGIGFGACANFLIGHFWVFGSKISDV